MDVEQRRSGFRIAPDNAWIETGMVSGRDFKQAWWRSTERIFLGKKGGKVKSLYIGKVGSPQHLAAIESVKERNRLKALERQLKILEKLI